MWTIEIGPSKTMSTPPQETDSIDVHLSREEQWVVHHVLTRRADDAMDENETPPAWLLELAHTIESGPDPFDRSQATKLVDALSEYIDATTTPDRDLEHARSAKHRIASNL